MRKFILLAALTSLTAMPAYAEDPAKPAQGKLICKGDRVLGSNLSQRICMTKERWAEEKRKSKDRLSFDRPVPPPIERSGS